MAILVRSADGPWEKAEQKKFLLERHLQDLLLKTPELIETLDGNKLVLTDEAGLSGGLSADLVGITADGEILIIEAKLASNPESRRKIIGQIFEYGACLWEIDYDTFDAFFSKKLGKSLIQVFMSADKDFDDANFRKVVETNLSTGKFHLLIAVDEMNEALNRILTYISTCSKGLRLEALALRLFEQGDMQVLAPQRYALPPAPSQAGEGVLSKPTIEEIIERSSSQEMREKIEVIVHQWRLAGNYIYAGKLSLSFKVKLPSRVVTMFWATPDETWGLQANFASMEQNGMPAGTLADLRKDVSMLEGISPERMIAAAPVTKFSQVPVETVASFVHLMVKASEQWRQSLQSKV